MKKINILSKTVYNRIAAGEVIDRPYSAVKELVENSLDAGATQIEVYIERGGKQLIKIIDNGCGIERDDMAAAFMPHATSKIANAEDLDKITTLGFRGEALASIAAIARVELLSVTDGNIAYRTTCSDGVMGQIEPAALEKGTVISVYDLFYNTPVRAKFLKTDKKEESDITNIVSRYILGNPAVSFKYFVDGKLELQSHGGGLDEAMARVYGAKTVPQCFKINAEKDGIKIHGFIGNQNFFKPNKTYQSLFLNGRYIVNTTISTAITNAYASYMMKRQYPFYVLNVEVPLDMVDVNVHPNKADVRFVDNRAIFSAVYSVLSSVLDGTVSAAQFVVDSVRLPEIQSTIDEDKNKIYKAELKQPQASAPNASQINFAFNPNSFKSGKDSGEVVHYRDPNLDKYETERIEPEEVVPHVMQVSNDTISPVNFDGDNRIDRTYEKRSQEQQKIVYESCKFKGNLFNTYLIYEMCDTVYFIDQHAAHERLIYDRLREKIANRKVDTQGLLIPYLLDVNAQEAEFIKANERLISNLGFSISEFGVNSFRIDDVPVDLQNINLKEFFDDLLSDLKGLKEIKLEDILKDKIATTACKHAIKGGMPLSEEEVKALFKMMDGDVGLKCPHGRPVCVSLNKKDIEKMFKRIV
ncbi:MAG: DNA mismatch repair endonuclease MutL [Clostridia bacterium]|nr:DNA mismatch repair endonuclease MutL [Clostridia bacterium]